MCPFPEEFITLSNALPIVKPHFNLAPIAETAMPLVSGIFTLLWLVGIATLLVYSTVSLFRLRNKLIGAVQEKNIRILGIEKSQKPHLLLSAFSARDKQCAGRIQ